MKQSTPIAKLIEASMLIAQQSALIESQLDYIDRLERANDQLRRDLAKRKHLDGLHRLAADIRADVRAASPSMFHRRQAE